MSDSMPARLMILLALLAVPPLAVAQAVGLPPEWEVRKNLSALVEQVRRLKPLAEEIRTADWVQKGAPETYNAQAKTVREELDHTIRSADELSAKPERLTLALETLFRMQSLESLIESLADGARKYQNPALADLLRGVASENSAHRERLREYIVQLAAVKEHELRVMNEEAQRCRAMLSRQPQAKSPSHGAVEPK